MAGIYIHIPFCRKACHYCNFHFSTSAKQMDAMVRAINKEAVLRHAYINEPIHTIYFGGGTPSLLDVAHLGKILEGIRSTFTVVPDAEITLEANPDDIQREKLRGWRSAGVNRLSIGVQSFFDEDLRWMNRAHNAQQALQGIQLARLAGFDNMTIDLIYGVPTLTDERWKQNVEMALSLHVPHLSCYALTVEPKTALDKMIHLGRKESVDAEKQGRHFELLVRWLNEAGYVHYEISNFAKPDYRSKHNSSYWQGKPYLGLGPSAHSFNGRSRQWNIANNALYIKSIEGDVVPFEEEHLTSIQRLNEYIMTSLRTIEGISLQTIRENWNDETVSEVLSLAQKFVRHQLVLEKDDHLVLMEKGKLFADGIAADLFGPYSAKYKTV